MPLDNQILSDGVRFLELRDGRFKTAHLTAALFLPLHEETASENALLPFVLHRGCAAYPDFTALQKRLNQLYGARVSADISRVGEAQVLLLRAVCLDDRYALAGEKVAADCAMMLRDMLFVPALENGLFRREDVGQERRCLTEEIEAEINEKRLYARHQCEKLICGGEPYAVSRLGTAERVSALAPEAVTAAWKRVLETARAQFIYQGGGDGSAVAAAFREGFAGIKRDPAMCGIVPAIKREKLLEKIDHMAVNQCKLVMGFTVNDPEGQPLHENMAARLMNAVFGATPHSMLFRNVREKLSLCYYCASSVDRHKGVMLVDSGVEEDKVEEAKSEILRQLKLLQQGIFTDEDLESAKKSLGNQFGTIDDLQSTRALWYMGQGLDPDMLTPEQSLDQLNDVTKEQVIAAANMVSLSGIYLLKPNGEEEVLS